MAVATIPALALIFPSGQEWIIILIVGIVLFGRRLPEVGKQVGRTIVQLRQGMQKLRDEIDLDQDIREVKNSVTGVGEDLREDFHDSVGAPRIAMDPQSFLEDLTDEALAAPAPDQAEDEHGTHDVESAGESLFVQEAADAPPADDPPADDRADG